MSKRILSMALAALLSGAPLFTQTASAGTKAEKQTQLAEKVKVGVVKLGVGREANVSVKLRDKRQLAGYISEAREDSFVITDSTIGAVTTVAYTDVAQIQGHNLSKSAKIAIISLAIAAGLLAFFLILENTG